MKKLSVLEMEKTQGGFLWLIIGLFVGFIVGVIIYEANPPTV